MQNLLKKLSPIVKEESEVVMSDEVLPSVDPHEIPEFLQNLNWFNEDISGYLLDFSEPYKHPMFALSHNGTLLAILGELCVSTGKSGSGKTSFMSMVMAAILKGEYGGLRYELSEQIPFPVILYVDTEMGKDDTIAIKNRVCTLAGLDYNKPHEQFRILRQRDVETAEQRWRQILKAVWEIKPNFIFLDGMLDIVNDYNDQKECQPLIRQVMKLATHYNASVWLVLHENPTFEKMVGTLGSVLERKVSECFCIRKHKNETGKLAKPNRPAIYFSVEQKKARRFDQSDWDFEVINNAEGWGVPVELDVPAMELKTKHTPEEIQRWIEKGKESIKWPATRTEVYGHIFAPNGVPDINEQKELMKICINRRFFLLQSKNEMEQGQRVPKLKLNDEIFVPF